MCPGYQGESAQFNPPFNKPHCKMRETLVTLRAGISEAEEEGLGNWYLFFFNLPASLGCFSRAGRAQCPGQLQQHQLRIQSCLTATQTALQVDAGSCFCGDGLRVRITSPILGLGFGTLDLVGFFTWGFGFAWFPVEVWICFFWIWLVCHSFKLDLLSFHKVWF